MHKTNKKIKTVELVDAAEMNKKHPDTFEIPSEKDIQDIRPGDFVKLGFLDVYKRTPTERMWVKVITVIGDYYFSTLDNDPCYLVHVSCGDFIKFKSNNVMAILKD